MFKSISKVAFGSKTALFLSGATLGSLALKALTSDTAKGVYAKSLACGYQVKDHFDASLDELRQQGSDIVADAKAIYDEDKKKAEMAALAKDLDA